MAIKTYRTILEKSNPSVVREFQINDSRSWRELLLTLALIHGWDTDSDLIKNALTGQSLQYPAKKTIQQIFASLRAGKQDKDYPVLQINIPCRKAPGSELTENWTFRMEEVEKSADAAASGCSPTAGSKAGSGSSGSNSSGSGPQEPVLLWARGLNPAQNCSNIPNWNDLHYDLLKNQQTIDYRQNAYIIRTDQIPNYKRINQNLTFQVRLGRKPVKLNRKRATPLITILNDFTVSELKEAAGQQGFTFSSGLKKEKFISQLAAAMDTPENWERILEEMSIREYLQFEAVCTTTGGDSAILNMPLYKRCLLHQSRNYWDPDTLPLELMNYYEGFLYQGKDLPLLKAKKFSNALEACRILYAVFSRKQALFVANRMYPGEFTMNEIGKYWKANEDFDLLGPDIMYCPGNIRADDASYTYRLLEDRRIPYYTPDQKQLLEIAERGFQTFPEKARAAIEEQLRKILAGSFISQNDAPILAAHIYTMYSLGWNRTQIEKELQETYHLIASKENFRKLFAIIEKHTGDIHLIGFRGQTPNSMR